MEQEQKTENGAQKTQNRKHKQETEIKKHKQETTNRNHKKENQINRSQNRDTENITKTAKDSKTQQKKAQEQLDFRDAFLEL